MPLRARVTPLLTVYLDAIEGGRVEKVLVEDGAMRRQGPAASRSCPTPSSSSRRSRARPRSSSRSTICAARNWRSRRRGSPTSARCSRPNSRATKARRQYEREAPLAERGFVAGKQFNDTRDEYHYQQKRIAVLQRSQATDERLQTSQLAQQRASAASMQSQPRDRPRQSRRAQPARAGRRPALGLLDPGRPVDAARRADRPDRQPGPQQADRRGRRILSRPRPARADAPASTGAARPIAAQGHQNLSAGAERPVRGRSAVRRRRARRHPARPDAAGAS